MSCLLLYLNCHSDSFNELAWLIDDWVSDVGCPFVRWEYVLLLLINE